MKKTRLALTLLVMVSLTAFSSSAAVLETPESAAERKTAASAAPLREDEKMITFFADNDEVLPQILDEFTAAVGEKIALPRAVELTPYAPAGMIPKGLEDGDGNEYKLGSFFTVTDDCEFHPVFAPNDEDIIFYEDMEDYEVGATLLYGGAGPVHTPLQIKGISDKWSAWSDSFYFDVIDSYPDTQIAFDRSGDNSNRAILLDWWGDSVSFPGVTPMKSASPVSMDFNLPGTYRVSADLYIPSLIENSYYQSSRNGTSNTTSLYTDAGVALQTAYLRVETNLGMPTDYVTMVPGVTDKWFTLQCEFTLAEGETLSFLRVMIPGASLQYYVDNFKFAKVVRREAGIDYDLDGTVDTTIEFDVGDTITLPRYADFIKFAPAGKMPVKVKVGDKEYALGASYTFTVEDGMNPSITPVFGDSDEDIIFFEDMEGYSVGTPIVSGGAAPSYTPLKINGVTSRWNAWAESFYLRNIDCYADMCIANTPASTNKAFRIDTWYGSAESPAFAGMSPMKAGSDLAIGLNEPGKYRVSCDILVPSVISGSTYLSNGSSNTTSLMTAGGVALQSMQLRAEAPGIIGAKTIAITPDVLDKWQTLTCEFTLNEGDTLWFLRAMVPGYGHQFYIDNFRLAKLVRPEAGIDYDLDGTVDATIEFDVGDTITLPRYADFIKYAPAGKMPVKVKVGDKEYALGASYTFTAEDGMNPVITPVYGVSDEDLIFFEDMEGFTVGTPIVSGGAAPVYSPLKSSGVISRWNAWAESFYLRNIDCYADMCIANTPASTNKAFRIDTWYGSAESPAFAGMSPMKGGSDLPIGLNVPGKYRVSCDILVPSVISGSTYLSNGSSNTTSLMTAGGVALQSMYLRAETNTGIPGSVAVAITPDVLDKWQTLTCEFTLNEGDTLNFLRVMLPGYGHQFYIDNFRLAKLVMTAGVYLDAEKTAITDAGTFSFAAGDTVTLPSYADVLPYAPAGTVPLGYEIGGVMYEFGTKYTFRSTDPSIMEIIPSFGAPTHPVYGELIFNEDFEGFSGSVAISDGGAGGVNHHETSLADGVTAAFAKYASAFTAMGKDTLSIITIRDDFTGGNKALHMEGWLVNQTALRIASTGDTSMNITEAGTYTFSIDYLIPSEFHQSNFYYTGANPIASEGKKLRIWADVNGDLRAAEVVFDSDSFDAWHTLTASFALAAGETIDRLLIYTNDTADKTGELYIDNIKLYYNANTVSYKTSEGTELYNAFVREGDTVTLPGKDEIGFEPLFTYGGKEYYAGEKVTTAYDDTDLVITVSALPSPKLIEAASIRTASPFGLRFAAFVPEEKRDDVDEYGFIITTEALLNGADAKTLTFDGTVKYVSGAAYDKANGIDKVYSTDGSEFGDKSEGDGCYYTGVLINIPKTSYDVVFVGRPYLRIGDKTFYGKAIERSVNEVAEAADITLE